MRPQSLSRTQRDLKTSQRVRKRRQLQGRTEERITLPRKEHLSISAITFLAFVLGRISLSPPHLSRLLCAPFPSRESSFLTFPPPANLAQFPGLRNERPSEFSRGRNLRKEASQICRSFFQCLTFKRSAKSQRCLEIPRLSIKCHTRLCVVFLLMHFEVLCRSLVTSLEDKFRVPQKASSALEEIWKVTFDLSLLFCAGTWDGPGSKDT